MASTSLRISIAIQCPHKEPPLFVGHPRTSTNLILPRRPSPSSLLTLARRRQPSSSSPITSKKPKKKEKKVLPQKNDEEFDDLEDDEFEALFRMLEEDLKNDDSLLNGDEDDDLTEEDLKKLEEELAEALKDDEILSAFGKTLGIHVGGEVKEEEDDDDDDDDEEDEEEEEELEHEEKEIESPLKNWQLRRLAQALKKGRRKISVKNLAAELCLDRAIVLKLLREPPPSLLMMSEALPDEPVKAILEPPTTTIEIVPLETVSNDDTEPEVTVKAPVHELQSNWSAQKRIKKVQLDTLERVYGRTKRPTNAMISSIVHVTNLPRKRVVKWFEDKRVEEGVPERRQPFQRPAAETTITY